MEPADAHGLESLLLGSLFDAIARRVDASLIDELWIFDIRQAPGLRSAVFVFSAFDDQPDRRRLFTARATARPGDKGRTQLDDEVAEHATAPADRISTLFGSLLRRIQRDADGQPERPRAVRVAGDPGRWASLRVELGLPMPAQPESSGPPDTRTSTRTSTPPPVAPAAEMSYQ